ncbi:hypothetical protein FAES_0128 [Fibrella aestuarina BUZ 2]|uniref:DoxX family protein n=1 Tax=Fibrella aestuarina BUZ 2 TaxID=1166018 RepID=I0K1Y9_9BACT|nr:DoxX family membrane protein [Fibrella aestuarina]CCG98142.1 hypothetical protein FAES_0128 [Fibrella aestuarina BUZ 2]
MAFFGGLVAIAALLYGIGWMLSLDYLRLVRHDMLLGAAVMFSLIGVSHFRKPDLMQYMIPKGLPAPRRLVYLSGLAEIVLGLGLLIPATRTASAWGLIGLLIAIFPANINVAVNNLPPPGGLPAKPWYIWSRLLFQPLYIAWIWYAALAP